MYEENEKLLKELAEAQYALNRAISSLYGTDALVPQIAEIRDSVSNLREEVDPNYTP
jgi:hypothetical protein